MKQEVAHIPPDELDSLVEFWCENRSFVSNVHFYVLKDRFREQGREEN